mmetsp:Transcript_121585/g.389047  ORF Transcript_121585/g.389047 Transcript_121585/m.389047 type:complete len:220 (-) Transcript_121585:132-791(-)
MLWEAERGEGPEAKPCRNSGWLLGRPRRLGAGVLQVHLRRAALPRREASWGTPGGTSGRSTPQRQNGRAVELHVRLHDPSASAGAHQPLLQHHHHDAEGGQGPERYVQDRERHLLGSHSAADGPGEGGRKQQETSEIHPGEVPAGAAGRGGPGPVRARARGCARRAVRWHQRDHAQAQRQGGAEATGAFEVDRGQPRSRAQAQARERAATRGAATREGR